MAGIAGWIDWEQDVSRQSARMLAMGAALAHRGREQAGMWVHPPAALLSRTGPLDVSGQPAVFGSGDEAVVVVADGRPTNLGKLRRELGDDAALAGPHGATDAAVLVAAYRRWGSGLPERLDGPFALAIWDGRQQRLLLARDRLGVRPLFFAVRGQGLLFASELKGLLAHPAVPPEVDADGLAELLALSPNRTPGHGVFRGVREVLPGHIAVWDRDGLQQRPYWQLKAEPHRDTPGETVANVRDLLSAAVGGHAAAAAIGGNTVGSMLSGGLDSTAVVALLLAGQHDRAAGEQAPATGGQPLRTYSVEHGGSDDHFQPDAFQPEADGPWVARAVAHYGTEHETVTIDPTALAAALNEAMRGRDLPGMADIDVALYLFCREIGKTSPAVLSGEGADELFGGYPWFFRAPASSHFPWLTQLELRWGLLHPDVRRLCRPEEHLAARYEAQAAAAPVLPGEDETEARQRALTYHNLTAWGPVLIERSDRMGQRAGVQVLMPFCDHRLVEYVFNVPWALKAAGDERKALLREAMADLLPPDLLRRPKSPFPKTHNPVFLGAVRQQLLARLAEPGCRLGDIFDAEALRALATAPNEFDVPWFGQLMRLPQLLAWLLQFDAWLEGFRVTLI